MFTAQATNPTSNHIQVINYANNAQRAQSLLAELDSIPSTHASPTQPRFQALQADAGNKPEVQNLVKQTLFSMGRLDIVISNVGWTRLTNFTDFVEGTLDSDWDTCFLYNVKSHLWLFEASKSALEESEGAFITTASLAGVKPSGSSLPYAVTKAAQIHLAKSLAVICGPKIRVNSVSPGLMLTEWGMKFGEEKIERAMEATKLKRLAEVEVSIQKFLEDVLLIRVGCRCTSESVCFKQIDNRPEYCH